MDKKAITSGDWRTLPQGVCTGNVELWDHTIGCPTCGMNLWHMPRAVRLADRWVDINLPDWAPIDIVHAIRKQAEVGFDYAPYDRLFYGRHPWVFDEGHDLNDQDDSEWPAQALLVAAATRDKFDRG